MVRYPAPLGPGARIAVTAPSAGVPAPLRARLDVAVSTLAGRGYEVVLGTCLDGDGVTSAPAADRAAELQRFLLDPTVAAVVPPWGGELAVELLPLLDWDALAAADPTWVVGFSDVATLLLPLTVRAGWATLHGQNLMDTPYRVPGPLRSWLDVVTLPGGTGFVQGASTHHRADGFDRWEDDPAVDRYTLDTPGDWTVLDPGGGPVRASGRLVGGCVEVLGPLAGTPFGDVAGFGDRAGDDGLVLYLEAAEEPATAVARHLWGMRLSGWFERATCVLVGRTRAPASGPFTQVDAVRSALDGLGIPVVLDVECGHVPPHLALVNGARAEVVVDGPVRTVTQWLD